MLLLGRVSAAVSLRSMSSRLLCGTFPSAAPSASKPRLGWQLTGSNAAHRCLAATKSNPGLNLGQILVPAWVEASRRPDARTVQAGPTNPRRKFCLAAAQRATGTIGQAQALDPYSNGTARTDSTLVPWSACTTASIAQPAASPAQQAQEQAAHAGQAPTASRIAPWLQQLPRQGWKAMHARRQQPQFMQQQQQQQPQMQQPLRKQSQQLPANAVLGPQPVQLDRRTPPPALAVMVLGVLQNVKEFASSDFKVMSFKVQTCSNGSQRKGYGWEPLDVKAVSIELSTTSSGGKAASSSRSPGSSNRGTASNNFAARLGRANLVVTCNGAAGQPGLLYQVTGTWEKHPTYGWQVRASSVEHVPSASDPISYLTSLPSVGPKTAERIVQALGPDWLSIKKVLCLSKEQAIAQLCTVETIGRATAKKIKHGWDQQQVSLEQQAQAQQELNLPSRLVQGLQSYIGAEADVAAALRQDPYAPYRMVPGYSLQQADQTAAVLGISPSLPQRGAAYLQAVLLEAHGNSAHTGLSWAAAETAALSKLRDAQFQGWPNDQGLRGAAELLVQEGKVVVEEQRPLPAQQQQHGRHHHHHHQHRQEAYDFVEVARNWSDHAFIYLQELHQAEQDNISYCLSVLNASCRALQKPQGQKQAQTLSSSSSSSLQLPVSSISNGAKDKQQLQRLEQELSEQFGKEVSFNDGQRAALLLSRQLPVLAVTGGPGCGKTLVSQAVARWWMDAPGARDSLFMAAPTGRAAQRLQEVLSDQYAGSVSSSTIHRLLGYRNSAVLKKAATEATSGGKQALPDVASEAGPGSPALVDLDLGAMCEFNRGNCLPQAKFLVDEVSMMDMVLAAALFNALGGSMGLRQRRLMLVGDPDQLPPVGAGQPVADALAEGMLPCVDLHQIYRTAANSAIVACAHAINRGQLPTFSQVWDIRPTTIAADISNHIDELPAASDPSRGLALAGQVLLLQLPDTCLVDDVAAALQQVVQQLLPRLAYNMQQDVQVLSPIKYSAMGTEQLNRALQGHFNPPRADKEELAARSGKFKLRVGDRVTQLKNDPQLDVYNGEQGFVESIDTLKHTVIVKYPPRSCTASGSSSTDNDSDDTGLLYGADTAHRVTYQGGQISDMLQPAWVTTVHKAQGGEFPVVLMPLHQTAARLLRRQLLYTAVSRAQQLLVLVGPKAAIQRCLDNRGFSSDAGSSRFRAKLRSARVKAGLPTIDHAVFGPNGWE